MRISEAKRVRFFGIKFVSRFIKNLISRKIKFQTKFYWQFAILICRMNEKENWPRITPITRIRIEKLIRVIGVIRG